LSKIQNLNLSKNYLDGYDEDVCIGLDSLEKLDLNFNYIKVLGKNYLNYLYSLKFLYLNNNGLKQIEGYSFKYLKQLNELNLQSNKLFELKDNRTFSNLINLKKLNLNSNNFESINKTLKDNLKHLISLEFLFMANNYIEYLNGNDFEFNPGLKTIDLNFNQIRIRQGNIFYGNINDPGSGISFANLTSLGLHVASRISTTFSLHKNGSLLSTGLGGTRQLPAINQYILARNQSGSADNFSSRQLSLSFIGSSNINQSTFYTAVQALGTSIGWAV
jgi:Leucine-rich repeat (LRR) protein